MANPPEIERRTVDVGEVRLDCAFCGSPKDPLVVLLHGFPACAGTWRAILPAVAAAGFLAVAPDMRGYAKSEKPSGVAAYSVAHLVSDVAGLITALGQTNAHVVGHDFGGGVAWAIAMAKPEMVRTLTILNAVHPVGFEAAIKKWSQLKKSWYLFFFQLPWIPEWWLARKDFAFLRSSLADDGLATEAIEEFIDALRAPGALEAALNWYRASFRDGLRKRLEPKKIETPTLIVWGEAERHLERELSVPPDGWVENARTVYVPNASHWVHHDAPARVTELLLEQIRRP
jgi:pimeloyl-ACP methyl ester carboxylesterase